VFAALALLGGSSLLVIAHRQLPRITEEQYTMIQVGMTHEEVEAVLGCPPGNYTTREDFLPIDLDMRVYAKEQEESRAPYMEWAAHTNDPPFANGNGPHRQNALAMRVWFDERGTVIHKCRLGIEYTPESPTDPIRRWLRKIGISL
jgi:hypothetical protein